MLKKVIAVVVVIAIVIGAVIFLGSSNPYEDQEDGSQFAIFAIMKDGSEVPLTGGFILQPNSIARDGQIISALKVVVQVAGTSPDYDEFKLTSVSQFQFRLAIVIPVLGDSWFSTTTISASTLFQAGARTLPFDGQWHTVPDKVFTHADGWALDSDGALVIPASFIQDKALAELTIDPGTVLNVPLKFEFSYDFTWNVPEDTAFQDKQMDGITWLDIQLVEGEAGLEGQITL